MLLAFGTILIMTIRIIIFRINYNKYLLLRQISFLAINWSSNSNVPEVSRSLRTTWTSQTRDIFYSPGTAIRQSPNVWKCLNALIGHSWMPVGRQELTTVIIRVPSTVINKQTNRQWLILGTRKPATLKTIKIAMKYRSNVKWNWKAVERCIRWKEA